MTSTRSDSRRRAWCLYFAGQATIALGAGAMSATHSYLPLALAGSAGLMLTFPLVRHFATRRPPRR